MSTNKRELITATNGQIFSVSFIKKDGTERAMNCRLGVKKHLKGGESTTKHLTNLVTVYSIDSSGYRNINLDTVKQLKISGNVYNFEVTL